MRALAETNPVEIIAERRWRSAVFTTFALSLSFFESIIMRALRAAGCRNIVVFVDPLGYRSSLFERQMSGVGRSYSLVPTTARSGSFHLKLCYLEGEDDEDCLLVGSGNLTYCGCGRNFELVDIFLSGTQPSVFGEAAEVLELLATAPSLDIPEGPWLPEMIERARAAGRDAPLQADVRLACSLARPIGDAIAEAAAELGGCRRIIVLSPYFESLEGVQRLWRRLDEPEFIVALPGDAAQASRFPFPAAAAAGLPARAVSSPLLTRLYGQIAG